jgi:alpha-galactosidase
VLRSARLRRITILRAAGATCRPFPVFAKEIMNAAIHFRTVFVILGALLASPLCNGQTVAAEPTAQPGNERQILSPAPPDEPRINGAKVYGARPGHPLLYRIPCTGRRPMKFAADGLPAGLTLDAHTGIISGVTPQAGEYAITLRAENALGNAERAFKLVAGPTLALTPPMGYNHWYTHYNRITQELMQQAADVVVASGMADAGYQYVNVDDCWMNAPGTSRYQTDAKRVGPIRDAEGNIVPNAYFPDMKRLADYIHAKGLKAGIYTTPGRLTCAGFAGAYQHEAQDARQFAAWGYDFLKYDWCSYGQVAGKKPDLAALQKPYRLMGDLLKQQPRDIQFNFCQYGMGDVWKWGAEVGGQSWRTGGDLGFELNHIFEVALKNCGLREYNKPGAWNDPDYIQIGWIGAQRGGVFELSHPCPLTPNEQYSFMSLWCLMSCPLFYSGDMSKLDDFTLRILCNAELIDINQDSLGQCARVLSRDRQGFILVKDLADGGKAIGLCNQSRSRQRMSVRWGDTGLAKPARVRDCWRGADRTEIGDHCEIDVSPRFVEVLRLYPEESKPHRD